MTKHRETVRDALRSLDAEGRLTAEDVVAAAEDPASPLHQHFNWDDQAAANLHRQEQARALIRSFRISFTVHRTIIRVPEFVRDENQDRGYTAIVRVKTDEDRARKTMITEFSRAAAALKRARAVAVALGMEAEVDIAINQIAELDRKISLADMRAAGAA